MAFHVKHPAQWSSRRTHLFVSEEVIGAVLLLRPGDTLTQPAGSGVRKAYESASQADVIRHQHRQEFSHGQCLQQCRKLGSDPRPRDPCADPVSRETYASSRWQGACPQSKHHKGKSKPPERSASFHVKRRIDSVLARIALVLNSTTEVSRHLPKDQLCFT